VLPHILTNSTNKTKWSASQFTGGMGAVWAPEPVWINTEDKNNMPTAAVFNHIISMTIVVAM